MSIYDQLTAVKETGYANGATAATRGIEFTDESLEGDYGRIESEGVRPGNLALRTDRFAVNPTGGSGTLEFEVGSKGFAWWTELMLGAIATAGPTDSAYTHTATVAADLLGKSAVVQVGRTLVGGSTPTSFTYEGCKASTWELSAELDSFLKAALELDFNKETCTTGGIYTLQTAAFPTPVELLHYGEGVISLGGTPVGLAKSFSVKGDNKLDVARRGLRGSTLKKEPLRNGLPETMVDIDIEWDTNTNFTKVSSATAAGAILSFSAVFTGAVLLGATTYPSVTLTIPSLRLDKGPPVSNGYELNTQSLTGKALYVPATSPITIATVSLESTP